MKENETLGEIIILFLVLMFSLIDLVCNPIPGHTILHVVTE